MHKQASVLFFAFVSAAASLMSGSSQAAYVYFDDNTTDGKYETVLNWYDGSFRYLPAAGQDALIASGLTATLSSNVSSYVPDNLYVGYVGSAFTTVSGNGTLALDNAASQLNVGSFTLGYSDSTTTTSTGTLNLSAGSLTASGNSYIGRGDTGVTGPAGSTGAFTQTGGTCDVNGYLYLGYGENTNGYLNVSGNGSQFNVGGSYFYVGYSNNTTAEVTLGTLGGSDTSTLTASTVRVANGSNSASKITIQGAATLEATYLHLAYGSSSATGSTADVYIKDDGALDVSSSAYIGRYGAGKITQTGGTADFDSHIYVGMYNGSDGKYDISDGTFNATGSARYMYIGNYAGSNGEFLVGGDAEVNIAPELRIGYNGTGKFEQTDGTTIVSNSITLGYGSTGDGTLSIKGGTFESNTIYVGQDGKGTLNIEGADADVDVTGSVYIGSDTNATSSMNMTDGSFEATGSISVGTNNVGQLTISGGSLSNTGTYSNIYVGQNADSNGTLNIHQTTAASTSVSAQYMFHIGDAATATGHVVQTGGDVTAPNYLTVGNSGTGTYDLQGGTVTANYLMVARNAGSTGTLTHSGGTLTSSSGFWVGDAGEGTYNISGSAVLNANNSFLIGHSAGSDGEVNQSGGTVNAIGAKFGENGPGDYNITAGSATFSGTVNIGFNSGVSGAVDQDGGSFTARKMLVGVYGNGTYDISGGSLSVRYGKWDGIYVGYYAGGYGEFNLSGSGDVDADWISIGADGGDGEMNVSGGTMTAVEEFSVGGNASSTGTLTVTGGAIEVTDGSLHVGHRGVGTLNFTGGTFTVSNRTYVGSDETATGLLNFGAGTGVLNTKTLLANPSDITGSAGTINTRGLVSDVSLVFDDAGDLSQTLTWGTGVSVNLNLTTPANNGVLGAGYDGTGTLTITNGVTVTSEDGYLGWHTGSSGTATVSNGATWNVGYLVIGRNGTGVLNFTGGTIDIAGDEVETRSAGTGTLNFQGGTLKDLGVLNRTAVNLQSGGSGAVFQQANYAGVVNSDISGDGTLTKTGAESLTLAGTNTYTGLTTLQEGSLILGLNAHNAVLGLGGVDIQTETGKLVFDYTGGDLNASTVRSLLATSFNSGWTSGQFLCSIVDSAHGLGFGDNTTEENVFVQYALCGDANFDSSVNLLDLTILSANWSDTDKLWTEGDFNYDGEVNLLDLTILSANWGQTDLTFQQAAAMVGLTAVPEPGTLALLACGLLGLAVYVWRKRK